mgnify:CR=1 FL=1
MADDFVIWIVGAALVLSCLAIAADVRRIL